MSAIFYRGFACSIIFFYHLLNTNHKCTRLYINAAQTKITVRITRMALQLMRARPCDTSQRHGLFRPSGTSSDPMANCIQLRPSPSHASNSGHPPPTPTTAALAMVGTRFLSLLKPRNTKVSRLEYSVVLYNTGTLKKYIVRWQVS